MKISVLIIIGATYVSSVTHDDLDYTDQDLEDEEDVSSINIELHEQLQPAPHIGDRFIKRTKLTNDTAPGELGTPVYIDNPTEEQQILIDRGYERNAFNEYVSDMISIHRMLPDYRNDWCKRPGRYLPESQMLPTSIIICFFNEAWSVLLRSVHSILDRTPPHLLKEIILVDDFSDFEHLGEKLEYYMGTLRKVKLIRAQKREGLIRARMLGASHATGSILTFFDSHIEVTEGWYQPIADRITRNFTAVMCPVIDSINDDTMEFQVPERSVTIVGGFNWDLTFTWVQARDDILRQLKTPADPIPSPTMAGGLFSIHKDFWEMLGKYDEEFEIWGAENLELSFKTWMCGGTLEISPCSHVGHIYRKRSPYSHKIADDYSLSRNLARLASVWLDDYAAYYFSRQDPDESSNYGDVSSRIELKEKLQCKGFDWYLKNIYPNGFNPNEAVAQGEVRNQGFGGQFCLDAKSVRQLGNYKPAFIWRCHRHGGNQFWMYTKSGEMRRDDLCMDYSGGDEVLMIPCHGERGNQEWYYDHEAGILEHLVSELCLTMDSREVLSMTACEERITQRWSFERHNASSAPAV